MVKCEASIKKVGFDKKKLTITLEAGRTAVLAEELAILAGRGMLLVQLEPSEPFVSDDAAPELPLVPANPLCICGHIRRVHKGAFGLEDGACLAPEAIVGPNACPCVAFESAEVDEEDLDDDEDEDDDGEEDEQSEAADAPEKVDTGEDELQCVCSHAQSQHVVYPIGISGPACIAPPTDKRRKSCPCEGWLPPAERTDDTAATPAPL